MDILDQVKSVYENYPKVVYVILAVGVAIGGILVYIVK